MAKIMCPRCYMLSMDEMKDLAASQRKYWVKLEEDLEADIAKEEKHLEEEFAGLEGYEQEPD